MPNFRVAFYTDSNTGAGQGHTTRALAIKNAIKRLGYLDYIDFYLTGMPDNPTLWDDTGKLKTLDPALQNHPLALQRRTREIETLHMDLQPDIMLIDGSYRFIDRYLLHSQTRPENIWGVIRYTKTFMTGPDNIFDRVYQIENFHPAMIAGYLTKQSRRSLDEKEGVKIKATDEYNDYREYYGAERLEYCEQRPYVPGEMDYTEWQVRVYKPKSMLIAPVVNVDPDRVMGKATAKAELCKVANLDPAKPLALVIGRTNNVNPQDKLDFEAWYTAKSEGYQLLVAGSAHGTQIPELYRYMSGADLILAACGYNSFYETRYLKQLGKLDAQLDFYPLKYSNMHDDQTWRYNHRENLLRLDESYHVPVGNGADYLAKAILIKAGLIKGGIS